MALPAPPGAAPFAPSRLQAALVKRWITGEEAHWGAAKALIANFTSTGFMRRKVPAAFFGRCEAQSSPRAARMHADCAHPRPLGDSPTLLAAAPCPPGPPNCFQTLDEL